MTGIRTNLCAFFDAIGGEIEALQGKGPTLASHIISAWLGYWGYAPRWLLQSVVERASSTLSEAMKSREKMYEEVPCWTAKSTRREYPAWRLYRLSPMGVHAVQHQHPRMLISDYQHWVRPAWWKHDLAVQATVVELLNLADPAEISEFRWEHRHASRDQDYPRASRAGDRPDCELRLPSGIQIAVEAENTHKWGDQLDELCEKCANYLLDGTHDHVVLSVNERHIDRYRDAVWDYRDSLIDRYDHRVKMVLNRRLQILPNAALQRIGETEGGT